MLSVEDKLMTNSDSLFLMLFQQITDTSKKFNYTKQEDGQFLLETDYVTYWFSEGLSLYSLVDCLACHKAGMMKANGKY